jgi:hypothetical protein
VDNPSWVLLRERTSHLRSQERQSLAIMWGSLLAFGPPALALTWLNDPRHLPLALIVIIGGTVAAVAFTALKVLPKGVHVAVTRQSGAEAGPLET